MRPVYLKTQTKIDKAIKNHCFPEIPVISTFVIICLGIIVSIIYNSIKPIAGQKLSTGLLNAPTDEYAYYKFIINLDLTPFIILTVIILMLFSWRKWFRFINLNFRKTNPHKVD